MNNICTIKINPFINNGKNSITGGTVTTVSSNLNIGQSFPSAGGSSINWNQSYPTIDTSNTLTVKGQLVLNGQDLEERLKTIEKVLCIPERDVTLEAKYPKLKEKYDDYIKTLSQYRMWEKIKGKDNEQT